MKKQTTPLKNRAQDMTADTTICSAEQAAALAADQAENSAQNGTFGVGGILLGPDNDVVCVMLNRVLEDGKIADPTAHVERQIVDWYFEQRKNGVDLPEPGCMTIVSSLDPCLMCAGAILGAGFNVISVTHDPDAGINVDLRRSFKNLPPNLRDIANARFAYFGVAGKRPYDGPPEGLFQDMTITRATERRAVDAFTQSMENVRNSVGKRATETADATKYKTNNMHAAQRIRILKLLRKYDDYALIQRVPDSERPGGRELTGMLISIAERARRDGHDYNAAALVDPYGNVLLTAGGREKDSRIQTPLMRLLHSWARLRAEADPRDLPFLPPVSQCRIVTLKGPGRDAVSMMELGAYGSALEGSLPEGMDNHWQYIMPRQSLRGLKAMLDNLPPLYRDVIRVRPHEIGDVKQAGGAKRRRTIRQGRRSRRRYSGSCP